MKYRRCYARLEIGLAVQSKDVNLSQYKKIENQWAKAISEGKK